MINLLRHIKYCFISFILLGTFIQGFSLDIYSHTVNGAAVDLLPGQSVKNTEIQFRGFYGGQVQIGNRILLNGIVSAKTGNIFSDARFRDISSLVNIDEASVMCRFKIEQASAQASVFIGEHDTPGSDSFVKKNFGTIGFSSELLEKEIGFETPAVFPLNGIGTSFMIKYHVPAANAIYLYYNEKYGKKCLNGDFRVAGVSDVIIADFIAGLSLPFEKKDANGNDVVMVVKRADFHTGLTLLIGGNPFVNLYMQGGLARIQTKPDSGENVVNFSDIYFLFEPRFAIGKTRFSLSVFYLPEHTYKNIPYVDKSLGGAFIIKSIPIEMRSSQGVFGCITSLSMANPMTETMDIDSFSLKAVPFADITIRNGILKILLPIQPLKYNTPNEAIALSLSYTIRF